MSKEIHVWFNNDYPKDTVHTYYDSIEATNTQDIINTTQPSMANTKYLIQGYDIFIHPYIGKTFQLALDSNNNAGVKVQPFNDIEQMLLSHVFNHRDCSVTGVE